MFEIWRIIANRDEVSFIEAKVNTATDSRRYLKGALTNSRWRQRQSTQCIGRKTNEYDVL